MIQNIEHMQYHSAVLILALFNRFRGFEIWMVAVNLDKFDHDP
jgi:hypothetical protein